MGLVSILMPCRNAAPWIGRALDSALEQAFCEVEVIVVDDGSTDGSYEIARKFVSPQCHVVRQEHRGASAARNHAFALAQGRYIQYLDADDLLAPNKVARQLAAMNPLGPRALSWGSAVYLMGRHFDHRSRIETARSAAANGADFLADLWGADGEPGMVAVHQWLARRELIEAAGLWDESLTVDDDGEFFARVVLAADERLPVPAARCYYRKLHHPGNLSAAVGRESRHRRSAMEAACRKAGYLLDVLDTERTRRAVSRLVTQQVIDAYPDAVHRLGLDFMRHRQIEFSREFEAPPWFLRARPLIGWKTARLVQNFARLTRSGRTFCPVEHEP